MGPMLQGDVPTNAFILLVGFAMIFVTFFIAKKLKIIGDTLLTDNKNWAQARQAIGNSGQVSTQISDLIDRSDISNCVT